ncbi:MAG: hypothetical protein HYT89_05905 [Candidatus Omnitrophica bacterium]|nr:hypothetical protein [Candidatus Omnitrophota bacterium]
MPFFTSRDRMNFGVPLGGMGAGKIEVLPNGLFNAFTIQNNWSKPIAGTAEYPGILGYHLGIRAEGAGARLLQTVPLPGVPRVRSIRYRGVFPSADLIYEAPGLGLDIALEIFSPWIPSDVKHSSLPAVCFRLRVKNRRRSPVNAGFLFIGRNLSGKWCVGRRNRIEEDPRSLSLEFLNEDPSTRDTRSGALRFRFKKEGWRMSFMESWNAVTRNFSFTPSDIALPAWDFFAREGELPNTRSSGRAVRGENRELCGAVAAGRRLGPGEEKTLSFVAGWYYPHHPHGHRYAAWFKNAGEVSRVALESSGGLRRGVEKVQRLVFALPFPAWFNDALLTNLAPFFSSSWHVKDGRFAFYEAPVACPLMGTLDVGFYGSIPLSFFFPSLEISQIMLFAKAQREDGYIPHDLGKGRLDLPSDGTTFYFWKDLNPKFALMAWRDFLWSGDDGFLGEIYPHVRKAMRWSMGADRDGDGLPDHEGADQTFDLWSFEGAAPYTAGIFLAALLACEKMARRCGDPAFAKTCRDWFLKGRRSFENELWNGEYFGKTCALSQLNGQWAADLLGLGLVADRGKIHRAIRAILKRNGRRLGWVNSTTPDGRTDRSNNHARNIWPGMNYAFAGLCLTQGFGPNKLLKELSRLWDNVIQIQKSPWNQPDMMETETGRYLFGDSYYRNMAIWSIPIAAALRDKKTARILSLLKRQCVRDPKR